MIQGPRGSVPAGFGSKVRRDKKGGSDKNGDITFLDLSSGLISATVARVGASS